MRKLFAIALMVIGSVGAMRAQVIISTPQYTWKVLNTATTGQQGSYVSFRGALPATFSLQTVVSGTAPVACTFALQGSNDGTTWVNLDAGGVSCTASSIEYVNNKPVKSVRISLASFTQGDSTTVVTFNYAGSTAAGTAFPSAVPAAIASGGTGATDASTALANLGGLPLTGGTLTGGTTWSAAGGTFSITPSSNRITFATTGSFTSVFASAANAYWDAASGFNNFIGTQNAGQIIQIGTASGSNTIVGTLHYGGTVPTASVGTIETHSTNQAGSISALSAATTTTITFANSGWTNVAYCTASPSVSLAAAPYVSAISKTAVTFTFPSLTGSLYYNCAGS